MRRTTRRVRCSILIVPALLFSATSTRADLILSDNLANSQTDVTTAEGTTWLAARFDTDGADYQLSSVTLLLAKSSIGGAAELDIFSDGGLEPGTLFGTLVSPSTYSGSLVETTFTANDIALAANSTYWVVLQSPTGSFNWSWTNDNTGIGAGFQTMWSQSDDSGGTWFTTDNYPFQMSVSVRAVPEPSSLTLIGIGAVGLCGGLVQRKRTTAQRNSTPSH